jgi:hypothetical protein
MVRATDFGAAHQGDAGSTEIKKSLRNPCQGDFIGRRFSYNLTFASATI